MVLVAPGEIQQVILNLLLNAADAIDGEGQVRVHFGRTNGDVTIELEDNGCGMTAEQQDHAFDLFFTTKDVGVGTGLGLSTAHNIVTNHGGSLTLESEVGRGTKFTVRLPIQD